MRWVDEMTESQTGRKFWEIKIWTANHVCSKSQIAACSVSVFVDRHPGVEKITLTDGRYFTGDSGQDWSLLKFITYDQSVGEMLESLRERCREVMWEVMEKVYSKRQQSGLDFNVFSHLCPVLVLGFPHGQDLHASLGRMCELEKTGDGSWARCIHYTAHSCKGDSGGLVIPLYGGVVDDVDDRYTIIPTQSHHGHDTQASGVEQVNKSSGFVAGR